MGGVKRRVFSIDEREESGSRSCQGEEESKWFGVIVAGEVVCTFKS